MKLLGGAFLFVAALWGCASQTGSSPNVPKNAIETAADTKVADAGVGDDGGAK